MARLLALVVLVVTIFGIVDCAQSDERTRRHIPLWVWVTIMIVFPGIGAAVWLIMSRLIAPEPEPRGPGPLAPDDDPEFLRWLAERDRRRNTDADQDGPTDSSDDKG